MSAAALMQLLAPLVEPGLLIFSDQNAPRPSKPFSTLSVRSLAPITIIKDPVDEFGDSRITQFQQMVAEVQFYGSNSFDSAQRTGLYLRTPSVVDEAERLGVSISVVRSVTRVPELLSNSQFEERSILEFTVYSNLSITDNVGLIESVDLECFDHQHTINAPESVQQ